MISVSFVVHRQKVNAFDTMCLISCARVRVPVKHSRQTDAAMRRLRRWWRYFGTETFVLLEAF